mmetsp:Transcript_3681/g.6826  ORF Transcript_3681/g.6826 Transcript_3681/m.6826 type:complete len:101 (+) Transcript_3681:107-409(+)
MSVCSSGRARSAATALVIAAAASAGAITPHLVPDSMQPLPVLINYNFAAHQLRKLEISVDPISQVADAEAVDSASAESVVRRYSSAKGKGSVCFVVRRPG